MKLLNSFLLTKVRIQKLIILPLIISGEDSLAAAISKMSLFYFIKALAVETIYDQNYGVLYKKEVSKIHLFSHKIKHDVIRTTGNPCDALNEASNEIINVSF